MREALEGQRRLVEAMPTAVEMADRLRRNLEAYDKWCVTIRKDPKR